MAIPIHVTFKGLAPRADIDALVQTEVVDLTRHYDRIGECRVRIQVAHRHHASGNAVDVLIELVVPHDRLVIHHAAKAQHGGSGGDATLDHAVREAFAVARRLVADYADRRRDVWRSSVTESAM
jgi:hypothetical protein